MGPGAVRDPGGTAEPCPERRNREVGTLEEPSSDPANRAACRSHVRDRFVHHRNRVRITKQRIARREALETARHVRKDAHV